MNRQPKLSGQTHREVGTQSQGPRGSRGRPAASAIRAGLSPCPTSSQGERMRLIGPSLAVAAAVAALAAPAAHAASDYVVTLAPPAGASCDATIVAVTGDFSLSPKTTYPSALCGFAAPLSKSQVRALVRDPRVQSVAPDR